MITAAGYMIQDDQGNAIFGVGETVDEAWEMTVDGAGPFINAFGVEQDLDHVFNNDFKAYAATKALIEEVMTRGGAISWGIVNGVACTVEEEAVVG